VLFVCSAGQLPGALIAIDTVIYTILSGSNTTGSGTSSSDALTDDAFIDSIVFNTAGGDVTLTRSADQFVRGQTAVVRTFAGSVNAEFGDDDDGSDGDPNPFVDAGILNEGDFLPLPVQESTNPAIQNPSISSAVNSFSLTQGVDGEGANYTMDVIFELGITDDFSGSDGTPEFILFERGRNSSVMVQAIIGGTVDNPTVLTTTLSIGASDFGSTGIYTNTTEIGSAQELGVVGIDLSDLGIGAGQAVFGLRITSTNGTGADIPALFATPSDPNSQTEELPQGLIPEPQTVSLLLFASLLVFRKTRR